MKIKLHAKNRSYDLQYKAEPSLLLTGLSHGVDMPYACASGTCGTCRAKLISGVLYDKWPEAREATREADDSQFLLCQCVPEADCEIEIDEFAYLMDAGYCSPSTYDGTISSWTPLTSDTAVFTVELDRSFDFDAGQFALLSIEGVQGYRAYSMVNFDRQTQLLKFLVKKKPGGGLTEELFRSNPSGTPVSVSGPYGRAIFTPTLKKNILCIAGGSGLAGMMSILSRAAQEGYFKQYKGYVYFGVRTIQDAFFLDELSALRQECGPSLEIVVGLSNDEPTQAQCEQYPLISFDSGFIHEVAIRRMAERYQDIQAYLAGPAPAVDAAIRSLIIQAKVSPNSIAYDKFS